MAIIRVEKRLYRIVIRYYNENAYYQRINGNKTAHYQKINENESAYHQRIVKNEIAYNMSARV